MKKPSFHSLFRPTSASMANLPFGAHRFALIGFLAKAVAFIRRLPAPAQPQFNFYQAVIIQING